MAKLREQPSGCSYKGQEQPIGTISPTCRICVAKDFFDQKIFNTTFREQIQIMATAPEYSSYTDQEKINMATDIANTAANLKIPMWVSYNSIYKCTDCIPSGNDRAGRIYRSDEAEKNLQNKCLICDEEAIPNSNPVKYKAKYSGGPDPDSCDSCQKNSDGQITPNGKCIEMSDKNNNPSVTYTAQNIDGKCECVPHCQTLAPIVVDLCPPCQECRKDSTKRDSYSCKDKCEGKNTFICIPDNNGDYGCFCKFYDWTDGPVNPPRVRCPPTSPNVVYNNDGSCSCACDCSGTNVVCATDENQSFIGCMCKYVTEEQMTNMLRPNGQGYFGQAEVCKEPDKIIATEDGGCKCGYDASSLSLDFIP